MTFIIQLFNSQLTNKNNIILNINNSDKTAVIGPTDHYFLIKDCFAERNVYELNIHDDSQIDCEVRQCHFNTNQYLYASHMCRNL